jgi:signal transduction histidine kinase
MASNGETTATAPSPGARLPRAWTRAIEPHPTVVGIEARRQARLLAGLLLVIAVNDVIAFCVSPPGGQAVLGPLTAVSVALYALARTRRPMLAAWLLILALSAAMFAAVRMEEAYARGALTGTLSWLALALICGQIFLSARGLVLLTALLLAAIATLPLWLPIAPPDVGPAIGVVFSTGTFLLVFQRHREGIERDRLAELAAVNRDLEQEARARQTALVAAEAANVAKSRFLANMSHELRTPLNAVIGYVEMSIEDGDLDTSIRHDLGRALMASRHLVTIIGDILDLAKIEAGKLILSFEDVELAALVDFLVDLAEPLAADNGNRFIVTCPAGGALHTDVVRVRQAVLNLISNACKFTSRGEVELIVRDGAQPGWLEFAVRDTGLGISADAQTRIFEPFVQGDDSSTRRHGGTGLGLALTRQLATMLGGELSLVSAPGRGSTFTLALPRRPR